MGWLILENDQILPLFFYLSASSPLVSCADGLPLHWCEREWAEQLEETKIHMLIQILLEQIAVVL